MGYWWIAPLALLVIVAVIILWRRQAPPPGRGRLNGELARTLRCHGAARCHQALQLLTDLERSREADLHFIWERLELPLLEALPDCPPLIKGELLRKLEACHAACRSRAFQKRIIDLRNTITL